MTLAVTCQLPVEMGGAEGKCMFIDTEGTFRSGNVWRTLIQNSRNEKAQIWSSIFRALPGRGREIWA